MPVSLVASVSAPGALNGVTSGAVNTAGATLLVVVLTRWNTNAAALTDSKANTWTLARAQVSANGSRAEVWYCPNPVTGSGHTFAVAGPSSYSSLVAMAFGGTGAADSAIGSALGTNGTSVQPGSLTPAASGSVIVTAYAANSGPAPTVNSGFSASGAFAYLGSTRFATGAAYLIQPTAAPVNPTWTISTGSDLLVAAMVVFAPIPAPSLVTDWW